MITKFVLTLLLVGSCQAAPSPQGFWETISSLQSYLPDNVRGFIEETINDGSQVVGDLYEDLMREGAMKIMENMEDFGEAYELMVEEMLGVFKVYERMIMATGSGTILTKEELGEIVSGLDEAKKNLTSLRNEVEKEMMMDYQWTGEERDIQSLLTSVRYMIAEIFSHLGQYNKIREQLLFLNDSGDVMALDVVATYMGNLKKIYADLFKNLGEIDWESIGKNTGGEMEQNRSGK